MVFVLESLMYTVVGIVAAAALHFTVHHHH